MFNKFFAAIGAATINNDVLKLPAGLGHNAFQGFIKAGGVVVVNSYYGEYHLQELIFTTHNT